MSLVIGAPIAMAVWLIIMMRWRRGFYALLVFLPFAGVVSLAMAPNKLGLLLKDLLLIMPTYLAILPVYLRDRRRAPIPPIILLLVGALTAAVILASFNPNIRHIGMAAIGAKVWIFYIPLMIVAATYLNSGEDLVRILRTMVVVAVIPCVIGIIQFISASLLGYEAVMLAIYGPAAAMVTQNFAYFSLGADLFRIPSTFTFNTQYIGFCLAMPTVAYALMRLDPHPAWRSFARLVLMVVMVAAVLSGSRSAFVFIPILLALIYLFDGRVTGAVAGIIFLPVLVLTIMFVSGFDPMAVFGLTTELVGHYGGGFVLPDLIDTLAKFPLGQGTGMNTGPARHALPPFLADKIVMYEGYYAKTIVEMGWPGLLIVVSLFGALLLYGLRAHLSVRDKRLRSCSAAIIGFVSVMFVNSFKGWQIDLDPVNVYLWVYLGMLFKLPYLTLAPARPALKRQRRARPRRRIARRPAPAAPRPPEAAWRPTPANPTPANPTLANPTLGNPHMVAAPDMGPAMGPRPPRTFDR